MNEPKVIPSSNKTDPNPAYKDFPESLIPHFKGWRYQLQIQSFLDQVGLSYEGASKDFYEYLKHNNVKGYDIKVRLPNGSTLKIEVKARYIDYHIFPRSFEEEFLSKDCDLMVINDPFVLTHKQRLQLRLKGIKLYSTSQFKAYISKLKHTLRMGLLNIIRYSVHDFIYSFISDTRGISKITFIDHWMPKSFRLHYLRDYKKGEIGCFNCSIRKYCLTLRDLACLDSCRSPTASDPHGQDVGMRKLKLMEEQKKCLSRRIHMYHYTTINLFNLEEVDRYAVS